MRRGPGRWSASRGCLAEFMVCSSSRRWLAPLPGPLTRYIVQRVSHEYIAYLQRLVNEDAQGASHSPRRAIYWACPFPRTARRSTAPCCETTSTAASATRSSTACSRPASSSGTVSSRPGSAWADPRPRGAPPARPGRTRRRPPRPVHGGELARRAGDARGARCRRRHARARRPGGGRPLHRGPPPGDAWAARRFAKALEAGDIDAALRADDELHYIPVRRREPGGREGPRAVHARAAQDRARPVRVGGGRRSPDRHEELIRRCAAGDVDGAAAVAFETWHSLPTTAD